MKAAEELDRHDRVYAALSHRTRRQILHLLHLRGGSMTGGQIAERFSCRWPTISRHLAVLRKAGLVEVSRQGRERVYTSDVQQLEQAVAGWLAVFRGGATPPGGCLDPTGPAS